MTTSKLLGGFCKLLPYTVLAERYVVIKHYYNTRYVPVPVYYYGYGNALYNMMCLYTTTGRRHNYGTYRTGDDRER